uniref:Kinesin motor domain-containing protein n=2 Tax=Bursaphelenchus xylophilus TaxID=6326 RepID=A0A1I7SP45_BURXY
AHHLRIRLGLVFVSLNGYGDENVSYTIKLAKTCMSNMFY